VIFPFVLDANNPRGYTFITRRPTPPEKGSAKMLNLYRWDADATAWARGLAIRAERAFSAWAVAFAAARDLESFDACWRVDLVLAGAAPPLSVDLGEKRARLSATWCRAIAAALILSPWAPAPLDL